MATIQILKKKLRSIRSTQKITKAMQTASTAKFSKLNAQFGYYKEYCRQHHKLYHEHKLEYDVHFTSPNAAAPVALVVIASNKGMCGSFNSELLALAREAVDSAQKPYAVYLCGKKAQTYFDTEHLPYEKAFIFRDSPKYADVQPLLSELSSKLHRGDISAIKIVYQHYTNITRQTPVLHDVFSDISESDGEVENGGLFFPDEPSVVEKTADQIIGAFVFEKVMESALGAQAATLMAMRSAHDAASEYGIQLEREINQSRQKQVTADVIETSVESAEKEI